MKVIIYLDPLDKLDIKKDSSLLLALTLKKESIPVYLLFKHDLFYSNYGSMNFNLYSFEGKIDLNTFYVTDFRIQEKSNMTIDKEDLMFMRLDPPFDEEYLKTLWILQGIEQKTEVSILNSPRGILLNNEKLCAFKEEQDNFPSLVTRSSKKFLEFLDLAENKNWNSIILKPLDLFQGIGVEKIQLENNHRNKIVEMFEEVIAKVQGPIVCQPFIEIIYQGEVRVNYFKGKYLGSIIKRPKTGSFLANVAQGSIFDYHTLDEELNKRCQKISDELSKDGVDWIAFDIIDGKFSEVNVTCPGLLVESSWKNQRNMAMDIIENLNSEFCRAK